MTGGVQGEGTAMQRPSGRRELGLFKAWAGDQLSWSLVSGEELVGDEDDLEGPEQAMQGLEGCAKE